jgi:membrane protease YdiL (CAAX protease family)
LAIVIDIAAHIIALYLPLAALRGWRRYQRLVRDLAQGVPGAREQFYRANIARKSALVVVVIAWLSLSTEVYPFQLEGTTLTSTALWCAYLGAIVAASVWYFRRRGDAQLRLLQRLAGGLLPRSRAEIQWFKVFAVSAGVGEEIVFRWFLMSYFAAYWGASRDEALYASAAAFGLAHVYQGALGVLFTSLVGWLLGSLWMQTGTLLVPIVLHIALDLRILIIATPERMATLNASRSPAKPVS